MEVNDYVIQYPIDAVHTVKFAELLGIRQPRVVFPVSQSLKQKTNITGERHEYSYRNWRTLCCYQ